MQGPPGPPPGNPNLGMRPPGPPSGPPQVFSNQGYYPPGPPTAMPNFPPPLPAGWSEHLGESIWSKPWGLTRRRFGCELKTAPDKVTKYYYNSNTKQSTYTRPTFTPLAPAVEAKKKKKEKAKEKVPIPNTTWARITTSEGNVFYFDKATKRSEWTVPEEIKDDVVKFDLAEKKKVEEEEKAKKEKEEKDRLDRIRERERIRLEVEEERARKRKANEESGGETKKVKTEGQDQGSEQEKDADDEKYAPEDEQDEDAWQRAVAAEFAQLDAKAQEEEAEHQEKVKESEEDAAKKIFAVPTKVNVSPEEGRALFKVSLCVWVLTEC